MEILRYNELDYKKVKKQYDKVVAMLRNDDLRSAEVKKLTGSAYYRAKLDHTNRLLFKITTYNQKKYALLLEIIHNHEYDKSRFLNGAKVDDSKVEDVNLENLAADEGIAYINDHDDCCHILDKIISFDAVQNEIFKINPPLIIIGSAGSGKTMLTLEKMKTCPGSVLYITGSPYLIQNARQVYYANRYNNEAQTIDFLSYRELLETIKVPQGKEISFQIFAKWLRSINQLRTAQDANKLYEEFKGVISGNTLDEKYLTKDNYMHLGIKQSIYSIEEREQVYSLFEKYVRFLRDNNLYEPNFISFEYLDNCQSKYDFIVVDEVQDFTAVQLALILKLLHYPLNFILCGDSNQIVHPNFFSWAKIKSLFYQQKTDHPTEIIRILNNNHRNAPNVTGIANKILKTKNARFGSIDKESHYLVNSQSTTNGEVYCLQESDAILAEINEKTKKSVKFAVLVLRDDLKEQASALFQTPLIFSIYDAKGLEYDNVILYGFISADVKPFTEIARGITAQDLEDDFTYARVKDKADRSLEIYKFFINALYVAITRAVKNVYLIEKVKQHPLLDLLGLKPSAEFTAIDDDESSIDEWQKEAVRLEMQGKLEQADAIRNTILHNQQVPWTVINAEQLTLITNAALQQDKKNKEARLLLFEYALYYHQEAVIARLADIGFAPALKAKRDYALLESKYFIGYNSANSGPVMRQVSLYGVDFKTVFNHTPLMVATYFGNTSLVMQLLDKGANPDIVDNSGRNAFQVAILKSLLDPKFAREKLGELYGLLSPDQISFQIDNKLVKIDARSMEFFLVNAMMALAHKKHGAFLYHHAFTVDDFLQPLQYFPDAIIPPHRKRRAYISSILAKNEVDRDMLYNRKVFVRVRRGAYTLNPDILIKVNDEWVDLFKFINLEEIKSKFELTQAIRELV